MKKENKVMDGLLGEGIRMDEKFGKFPIYEFADYEKVDLVELKESLKESLFSLILDNGFAYASCGEHYIGKSWVRDNYYVCLALLQEDKEKFKKTVHAVLDFYTRMEDNHQKISWLIKEPKIKDNETYRFLHPRINGKTGNEIYEDWGFVQIDSVGMFLYSIYLGESSGVRIIRNDKDRKIIQLIIDMLIAVDFHLLPDNGAWEERRQLCTSSQGSALTGMTSMRLLGFNVPQTALDNAYSTLNSLLPKEAKDRDVDLAQLSLIHFNIVGVTMAKQIIKNIEDNLLKDFGGACRYISDHYYNTYNFEENKRMDRYYDLNATSWEGNESSWTFAYSFLSLAYNTIGDKEKAIFYAKKMINETVITNVKLPLINKQTGDFEKDDKGNVKTWVSKACVPEMFYAHSQIPNDNCNLLWSTSLAIVVLNDVLGIK